jgi:hypothetical protein
MRMNDTDRYPYALADRPRTGRNPPPIRGSDGCCFELVTASERKTAYNYKISSQ